MITMYENELAKHAPVLSNKGNYNKHRKPNLFWTTELNNLWKNVVEKSVSTLLGDRKRWKLNKIIISL